MKHKIQVPYCLWYMSLNFVNAKFSNIINCKSACFFGVITAMILIHCGALTFSNSWTSMMGVARRFLASISMNRSPDLCQHDVWSVICHIHTRRDVSVCSVASCFSVEVSLRWSVCADWVCIKSSLTLAEKMVQIKCTDTTDWIDQHKKIGHLGATHWLSVCGWILYLYFVVF